jgi:hypothetical protein
MMISGYYAIVRQNRPPAQVQMYPGPAQDSFEFSEVAIAVTAAGHAVTATYAAVEAITVR